MHLQIGTPTEYSYIIPPLVLVYTYAYMHIHMSTAKGKRMPVVSLSRSKRILLPHSTQVDNQLQFALNPIILYPYPPPPSIASKCGKYAIARTIFILCLHLHVDVYFCPSAPKPFIESTIIIRKTEQSNVKQIESVP